MVHYTLYRGGFTSTTVFLIAFPAYTLDRSLLTSVPPKDARGSVAELLSDGAYLVPGPTTLGRASSMAPVIFLGCL